jgi:hypothetical protein
MHDLKRANLSKSITSSFIVVSLIIVTVAHSQMPSEGQLEDEKLVQADLAADLEVRVPMTALRTSPRDGDEVSFLLYQRESQEVAERLKRFREAQERGARTEEVEVLRADVQMAVVRLLDLLPKVNAPITREMFESFEAVLLPNGEASLLPVSETR